MLREVARIQMARLPPNRPMVPASSASRSGIGRDVVAVEADQLERVGRVVDRALGQRLGALVDEADIGAVDEEDADARIGAPQHAVHVTGFDRDHPERQASATGSRRGRVFDLLGQGLGEADLRRRAPPGPWRSAALKRS